MTLEAGEWDVSEKNVNCFGTIIPQYTYEKGVRLFANSQCKAIYFLRPLAQSC